MKFSPDEDIRTVLAKSATDPRPKADSDTLSLRAQKRVRQNALRILFLVFCCVFMRSEQIAKQEKLRERRKKIKEKKAIAIANANAKKETKTFGIEPKTRDTGDADEENHASKRLKVASKDPLAKKVLKTSVLVQVKGRRIPTDAGRNSRKETTKAPVSEKSKRGKWMSEQTTPAQ